MKRKNDWHSADIIAALRKNGLTLAALSREAGLSSSTLANTLVRPWPKGELIIANRRGLNPEDIGPKRYFDWARQRPRKRTLRSKDVKTESSDPH